MGQSENVASQKSVARAKYVSLVFRPITGFQGTANELPGELAMGPIRKHDQFARARYVNLVFRPITSTSLSTSKSSIYDSESSLLSLWYFSL